MMIMMLFNDVKYNNDCSFINNYLLHFVFQFLVLFSFFFWFVLNIDCFVMVRLAIAIVVVAYEIFWLSFLKLCVKLLLLLYLLCMWHHQGVHHLFKFSFCLMPFNISSLDRVEKIKKQKKQKQPLTIACIQFYFVAVVVVFIAVDFISLRTTIKSIYLTFSVKKKRETQKTTTVAWI